MKVFTQSQVDQLLDEAYILKRRLAKNVTEGDYEPSFHIQHRYDECREELAEIQQAESLDALYHSTQDIKFKLTHVQARLELDSNKLMNELEFRGVARTLIMDSFNASMRPIKDYWTKEIY